MNAPPDVELYRAAADWAQRLIERWVATGGVPLEIALAMMERGRVATERMDGWTHSSFHRYGLSAACKCGCRDRIRRRRAPDEMKEAA